jgi:hypothetical protein
MLIFDRLLQLIRQVVQPCLHGAIGLQQSNECFPWNVYRINWYIVREGRNDD